MKFSNNYTLPIPLDTMWQLSINPQFHTEKHLALGATEVKIIHQNTSNKMAELDFIQTLPVNLDLLPNFARHIFKPEAHIHHKMFCQYISEHTYSIDLLIQAPNIPVTINVLVIFNETTPKNVSINLDTEILCRVPFIGERIARLLEEGVRYSMQQEHEYMLQYLEQLEKGCSI